MSQDRIQAIINAVEPEEAAKELLAGAKKVLPLLDEERRISFLTQLIGEEGRETEDGLVHF